MKIQFYTPLNHHDPLVIYGEPYEMPVVPRPGERIMFELDGYEYIVQQVCWTPHEEDYDVYVALR